MNTKSIDAKTLGFGAIAALLGAGFAMAASVSADTTVGMRGEREGCDPERREAIETTLEDGDYDAWKELMDGRGRITQVVTEESFNTFAEMHKAMEEGDYVRAQQLRKELGLGIGPRDGGGFRGGERGMGHRIGMRGGRVDVE